MLCEMTDIWQNKKFLYTYCVWLESSYLMIHSTHFINGYYSIRNIFINQLIIDKDWAQSDHAFDGLSPLEIPNVMCRYIALFYDLKPLPFLYNYITQIFQFYSYNKSLIVNTYDVYFPYFFQRWSS